MPSVWNINRKVNTNQNKMSSKLTFEVGEKFKGKILGKGEGKDVIIRLSDGWQFLAEIEGNVSLEQQMFVSFVVEGFKDGKLKLGIVKNEEQETKDSDSSFKDIIKKENLTQEDVKLLKSMISHNIPLTRENIINIKSIIQFSQKISQNPQEAEEFIDNFIKSKGLEPESPKAQEIKTQLKSFFEAFKGMSQEDIMTFLENNIDFTEENIDSFNKLFKGEKTVKEIFSEVNEEVNNVKNNKDTLQVEKNVEQEPKKVENIDVPKEQEAVRNNTTLATKAYVSNEKVQSKFSMLNLLKSMMGEKSDLLKEPIKEIITKRANTFEPRNYKSAIAQLNILNDQSFSEEIKKNIIGNQPITKPVIEKVLSNMFNNKINLTNDEFKNVMDIVRIVDEMSGENTNNVKGSTLINELKQIVKNRSEFFSNPAEVSFIEKDLDTLNVNKFLDTLNDFLVYDDEITKKGVENTISKIIGQNIEITNSEFNDIQDIIIKLSQNVELENKAKSILKNTDDVKIIQEVLKDRISDFSLDEMKALSENTEAFSDNTLLKLIGDNFDENGYIEKNKLENIISKALGREIQLSSKEFEAINTILQKEYTSNMENIVNDNIHENKFINDVTNKSNNITNNVFDFMSKLTDMSKEEIVTTLKDIISEEKRGLFTDDDVSKNITRDTVDKFVSKLLNKEVHVNEREYQEIKEVIKQIVSSNNAEEVSTNKPILEETMPNIKQKLLPKDAIKNNIKENIAEVKDVVKNILNSLEGDGIKNAKLLEVIKNSINDFKLFNSMSNEYYYVDIPVRANGEEYPCKLIIKDKRNQGKKIDSTNVKMVVTVKTINMGSIDGFINVNDSIINIDIKCQKKYMKVMDRDTKNLVDGLRQIGLFANVYVSEKKEEVDITTCREFFDNSKLGLLDRRV
ncbi:MAG: hypothetical protein SOZ71_08955 [Clostridium sp.]|nr:hypothetical protein [Clostridium sp.]